VSVKMQFAKRSARLSFRRLHDLLRLFRGFSRASKRPERGVGLLEVNFGGVSRVTRIFTSFTLLGFPCLVL
jgi:hypothetical protein